MPHCFSFYGNIYEEWIRIVLSLFCYVFQRLLWLMTFLIMTVTLAVASAPGQGGGQSNMTFDRVQSWAKLGEATSCCWLTCVLQLDLALQGCK